MPAFPNSFFSVKDKADGKLSADITNVATTLTLQTGEGVSDTANLHGWVKMMLCTHDDAVIIPCTQSSYQEFAF